MFIVLTMEQPFLLAVSSSAKRLFGVVLPRQKLNSVAPVEGTLPTNATLLSF